MNKYDFTRGKFLLIAIIFLTTLLLNLFVTLNYAEQLTINVNDYISKNGKKYAISNITNKKSLI